MDDLREQYEKANALGKLAFVERLNWSWLNKTRVRAPAAPPPDLPYGRFRILFLDLAT